MDEEKIERFLGKFVKVHWMVGLTPHTETGILRKDGRHYSLHISKAKGRALFNAEKVKWIKLVV